MATSTDWVETRGRPALPPDRVRSQYRKVRLTEAEAEAWDELARGQGVSLSELLRTLVERERRRRARQAS